MILPGTLLPGHLLPVLPLGFGTRPAAFQRGCDISRPHQARRASAAPAHSHRARGRRGGGLVTPAFRGPGSTVLQPVGFALLHRRERCSSHAPGAPGPHTLLTVSRKPRASSHSGSHGPPETPRVSPLRTPLPPTRWVILPHILDVVECQICHFKTCVNSIRAGKPQSTASEHIPVCFRARSSAKGPSQLTAAFRPWGRPGGGRGAGATYGSS